MLKEAGVTVHFHERVREQEGVELQGSHLVSDHHLGRKPMAGKDLRRLQLRR